MLNILNLFIFSEDVITASDVKGFGKIPIWNDSFSLIETSSQASPIPSLSESNWSGL